MSSSTSFRDNAIENKSNVSLAPVNYVRSMSVYISQRFLPKVLRVGQLEASFIKASTARRASVKRVLIAQKEELKNSGKSLYAQALKS